MTPNRHDFTKPVRLAGHLEDRLAEWLRAGCRLAAQRAPRHLSTPVEFALRGVELLTPRDALASLPEGSIGVRVALGVSGVLSLFASSRPVALALVARSLGDASETLPDDRELTGVEDSLHEYLIQQLFAGVLAETFPGRTPIPLAVQQREPSTGWGRLFGSTDCLLHCSIDVRGPMGDAVWHWLVPPQGPLDQLARTEWAEAPPAGAAESRQVEALVRELPVDVAVSLGSLELSLSEIGSLRAGDLLILGQRISEPLVGLVDGQEKFRAWPGRVGSRLAIQVESLSG
jgi:flagellar motor switch protein FliM